MKKRILSLAGAAVVFALMLTGCTATNTPQYNHPHPTSAPVKVNSVVSDIKLTLDSAQKKMTFTGNRNEYKGKTYEGKLSITFLVNNKEIGNATSIYSDLAGSVINVSFFLPSIAKGDQYSVKISGDPAAGFDTAKPIYYYEKNSQ